jgi:type IV pilus assembly protein PilO
MKEFDLNDLDFSTIGAWPMAAKAAVILVVCVILATAVYFLDIKGQQTKLAKLEKKEVQLKKTFEKKQATAANLEAYKKQMAEMKESFGAMLRQLPSKTEVEDLLVDISQTGLASGVEFQLFQPGKEKRSEFYARLPINIKLRGTYHEIGDFISGIAALPRIVTLQNISLKPAKSKDLNMTVTAFTYRYLDESEMPKKKKRKKRRR